MLILSSHTTAALQSLDRGIFGPFETFLKQDANRWVNTHQNRKVTGMQLEILIGGTWNRAASVAKAVSAIKATGIFPLDQNAITNQSFLLFSICDADETGEATEPDSSQSSVNNSHEHSSSTNSRALHRIGHSKPPLTPSKVLNKTSPVPRIPVKKTTKKQLATVSRSSEFIENKN
jgi:hypothetical protein